MAKPTIDLTDIDPDDLRVRIYWPEFGVNRWAIATWTGVEIKRGFQSRSAAEAALAELRKQGRQPRRTRPLAAR